MFSFPKPSHELYSLQASSPLHTLTNPELLAELEREESPPLSIAGKNSDCRKLKGKRGASDESHMSVNKRYTMKEAEPATRSNKRKMRTDTSPRRVTCEYEGCRKSFGREQELKRHMVTHFRTALASGTRTGDLEARYIQHTRQIGEARVLFECQDCGFFASRKDSLVRHQKESCGSKSKKQRRTHTTRTHVDAERSNARQRKRNDVSKAITPPERSQADSSSHVAAVLPGPHIHESDRQLPSSTIVPACGDTVNSTQRSDSKVDDSFFVDSIFPAFVSNTNRATQKTGLGLTCKLHRRYTTTIMGIVH
ncbi:hypothetical protein BD410DRAFT_843387 [Rickenella mellea]|uniref:C2H2-type domain-containing protein n=1 Tax=Rickenella mellea TaxID=50990 RepID=A0A4Y7PQK5_9AGAM|nr:hypothetical protein BD410DRAFT_843387 [Rickenella mellea]